MIDETPKSNTDGTAVKAATLLSRDLALLASASNYDVNDADDRMRSVKELTKLFFRLANFAEVDLFIEAGAKEAGASRRARRLLDLKRVVAFEANPYTHAHFARLHDNAAVDVEYRHLALSDAPGTVTFRVGHDANGRPQRDGRGSLLAREREVHAKSVEVTVEATTLDTFFADHDYARSAMWIDVEGAVEQVFHGGRDTLEKAAVVILEVEEHAYFVDQWLRADVLSHLYDRGLVPVARDFQSRYQYNVVLVRESLLDSVERLRWALVGHLSTAAAKRPSAVPEAPPAPTETDVHRAVREARVKLSAVARQLRQRVHR